MVDGDFGDSFPNVYIAHLLHPANQLGYAKWAGAGGSLALAASRPSRGSDIHYIND
jgi:hypothetical protein